jgi:hypothetical protein
MRTHWAPSLIGRRQPPHGAAGPEGRARVPAAAAGGAAARGAHARGQVLKHMLPHDLFYSSTKDSKKTGGKKRNIIRGDRKN